MSLSLSIKVPVSSVCQQLFSRCPRLLSLTGATNTNSDWLGASFEGKCGIPLSTSHQREANTRRGVEEEGGEKKRQRRKHSERVKKEKRKRKGPDRRTTSLAGAEMVTWVRHFSPLCSVFPSLKGYCVINNTAAFIHAGGPLCTW